MSLAEGELPLDISELINVTGQDFVAKWDYPIKPDTLTGKKVEKKQDDVTEILKRVPKRRGERGTPAVGDPDTELHSNATMAKALESILVPTIPVGLSLMHPVAPGLDSLLHILSYAVNVEQEVMDVLRY